MTGTSDLPLNRRLGKRDVAKFGNGGQLIDGSGKLVANFVAGEVSRLTDDRWHANPSFK
ncbi:MAG: hypothetical protein M2R45_01905 [Verrucomicrobia subdivision 3 bacterium]|nr:hypothetical protein [Limisphaerales bacterium]MCS1415703.1 hypothetical protein [Limisphaerales bacterium]